MSTSVLMKSVFRIEEMTPSCRTKGRVRIWLAILLGLERLTGSEKR
jgi:hypothetical protein